MNRNPLRIAAACILVATAQAQVQTSEGPPVPDMDEQTLQEKYHIPPTRDGLLGALHHPEGSVRSLAAGFLATAGEKDAVPAILAAMAVEPIPGVQVLMASAAARLGSEDGVKALKIGCEAKRWSPGLRINAALVMVNLGRNDCLPDVLSLLRSLEANQSAEDNQAALQGLYLIPRFKAVSPDELGEIKHIVPVFLRSGFAPTRAAACFALRQMHASWATEDLRNALAVEPEEYVRDAIEKALASIGSK